MNRKKILSGLLALIFIGTFIVHAHPGHQQDIEHCGVCKIVSSKSAVTPPHNSDFIPILVTSSVTEENLCFYTFFLSARPNVRAPPF